MKGIIFCVWLLLLSRQSNHVICDPNIDLETLYFLNRTTPSQRQTYQFKLEHPNPVGVLTTSSGLPVDVRDTFTLNMNQYINQYHVDLMTDFTNARIPERVVHAKGAGAWGYFVVTHDISQYTSADVFNGIGKITPVFARYSQAIQNIGGSDLGREQKALSAKFYTKEGNLDLLCLNTPVYFYRDAINFQPFASAVKRNVQTFLRDFTYLWDFATKKPEIVHGLFWLFSDYGIPLNYRTTDYFPIQTYELRNQHGDRYFAKFSLRTLQGIQLITSEEARNIAVRDPDYYTRDLFDAIEEKNYPAWIVEIDVMSYEDALHLDYDPFDVTRLWKKGTFKTVPIGRLTFNQNPDNYFRDVELTALNPANLVPGIPGPIDSMFRARRVAYRNAQIYRLGINHNRIPVNEPLYRKEYNRDGVPPVAENMKGTPIYYPNSFSGPIPYVDEARPKDSISLLQTKAVDLGVAAYFYNEILYTDAQRDRLVNNTVELLLPVAPYMQNRVIRLFSLIDPNLGKRLTRRLVQAEQAPGVPPPNVLGWDSCMYEIDQYHKLKG